MSYPKISLLYSDKMMYQCMGHPFPDFVPCGYQRQEMTVWLPGRRDVGRGSIPSWEAYRFVVTQRVIGMSCAMERRMSKCAPMMS